MGELPASTFGWTPPVAFHPTLSFHAPAALGEISAIQWTLIALAALIAGIIVGVLLVRLLSGQTLGHARVQAKDIVARAESDAKAAAAKLAADAEREAGERRVRLDAELEKARGELREAEKRLTKREDLFDRKEEMLTLKEQSLSKQAETFRQREERMVQKEAQAEQLVKEQTEKLYKLSGLTVDAAREELLRRVEEENRYEVAKIARKIVEDAEHDAKAKAREVTLMAIQRYATEHTSESTVRTVAIPSDDIKGRIIGREGRNIRAIERETGADIIVDDTPGVIVVSCFDKVRQAIAVEALETLVADGRMHPTRIEEVVAKVKGEIHERIIKKGKESVLEVNLRGVHPKVVEAMGKLHFRSSYGQNVLRHSVEVAYIAQIIADQLGLDGAVARRCGFLHDIGKAMDHEMEGGHPKIGMDFARQFGEREPVLNAIGGHHADIPSTSFYTPIVMAADAVSSARPGARRESMEKYVQRLTELQDIALSFKGVNEAYAIQAGREVRVMLDAAKVDDDEAFLIAHQIAKKVSEEMTFPGEIKVTVLRETRAIEYAR
ncbi:MAG: ribonuclease Y [Planctomycetota bacterium]|nr:ribonuclease Y [Planctomycetota bacterium]